MKISTIKNNPQKKQQFRKQKLYFHTIFALILYCFLLGSLLSIVLMLLFLHLLLKAIYQAFLKSQKNKFSQICSAMLSRIENQSYIQILEMAYQQIVFSGFLQLLNLEAQSSNEQINLAILILCFFTIFPVPFLIFLFLKKGRYQQYLESFYEKMKIPDHKFLIYLRKLIFCFSITILYGIPYLQISFLASASLFVALGVIIKKPFQEPATNKKVAISESLFFLTICSAYFLVDAEHFNEENRMNIAWITISLFYGIVIVEIFFLAKESISKMINTFKQWKLTKQASKIAPTSQIDEDKLNSCEIKQQQSNEKQNNQNESFQNDKSVSNSLRDDSNFPFQSSYKNKEDYGFKFQERQTDDFIIQNDLPKIFIGANSAQIPIKFNVDEQSYEQKKQLNSQQLSILKN